MESLIFTAVAVYALGCGLHEWQRQKSVWTLTYIFAACTFIMKVMLEAFVYQPANPDTDITWLAILVSVSLAITILITGNGSVILAFPSGAWRALKALLSIRSKPKTDSGNIVVNISSQLYDFVYNSSHSLFSRLGGFLGGNKVQTDPPTDRVTPE